VVGIGEWVAEAYLYFKGPLRRLHEENVAVGGTKFNLINSLRILSGGRVSSLRAYPGIAGWSDPWLLLWWLVFLLLAVAGIYAAWRARGWLVALAAPACAFCEYVLYAFPVRDNTRYLLPAWALLAVAAADGIGWLVAARRQSWLRVAAIACAAAFVVVELVTQHALLSSQSAATEAGNARYVSAANSLRRLGIRPPCVVTTMARPRFSSSSEPAAYYLGCSYVQSLRHLDAAGRRRVVVMVRGTSAPWSYARSWPSRPLDGDGNARAYIEPSGARSS
jgi:hypothetical protein